MYFYPPRTSPSVTPPHSTHPPHSPPTAGLQLEGIEIIGTSTYAFYITIIYVHSAILML
jgi:hypothetical protein